MSEEEKKDIETLIKKLSYCELEYQQNGYLSVGKFNAIKQAIQVIERQQKEIEEKTIILLEGAEKVKQLEKEIEHLKIEKEVDYISKDKIREKRKEIKEIQNMAFTDIGQAVYNAEIVLLTRLLGE